MRVDQWPPTVAIAVCLAFALVAYGPYVVLSEAELAGFDVYYGAGLVGPHLLSVFALVAVVLFAAGREGRTEPAHVAGITLVLGAALALLTLAWALSVRHDVVLQIGTGAWLEYHRWVLVVLAVGIAGCAAWYAQALGLVGAR